MKRSPLANEYNPTFHTHTRAQTFTLVRFRSYVRNLSINVLRRNEIEINSTVERVLVEEFRRENTFSNLAAFQAVVSIYFDSNIFRGYRRTLCIRMSA